jgi:2,3-bisphosphoglycerate-dependent phosphoglycerate mutase
MFLLKFCRYEKLNGGTESFAALGVRVQSFWTEKVAPELTAGKKVMIVAHGNALRSIIQRLDGLSHAEVREIVVPRCTPLEYRFTMVDGFVEVAPFPTSEAAKGLSARFLSSPDEVVKRLQEERSYIDVERISGGGL